jgi:hypothetical protein
MKNVLVVSTGYIDDLFKVAKQYSFSIQIYSDPVLAAKAIPRVSYNEYLGFGYVDDDVVDVSGLRSFLMKLNIMCAGGGDKKRFVFCTHPPRSVSARDVIFNMKFEYLDILAVEYKILTDKVINRDFFGSILLDVLPFEKKPEVSLSAPARPEAVSLHSLVEKKYILALEPITMPESDEVLRYLKGVDVVLAGIRMYQYSGNQDVRKEFMKAIEESDYISSLYYKLVLERLSLL